MIYKKATLTVEDITNLFLYESLEKPSNLVDDSLIRPKLYKMEDQSMVNRIEKNKLRLIVILVLIGFLLLNYFGFCQREFRFLSDKERIEIAVQKALNFYKGSGYWGKFENLIDNESPFDRKRYERIPYKDSKEFFAINPNCCEVSRSANISEGRLKISVLGCMFGNSSPYFVSGKVIVNYKEDGQIKTGIGKFTYKISSCGKLYYLFD